MQQTRQRMTSGATPQQALRYALGSRLMPMGNIRYDQNKVAFRAASRQGEVAPLIIRVDSK